MKATTTSHKCDVRCQTAHGTTCRCNCGGAGHGRGLVRADDQDRRVLDELDLETDVVLASVHQHMVAIQPARKHQHGEQQLQLLLF